MPSFFSKPKGSVSKPSVLSPSPTTMVEGAVTLQTPVLPPTTTQNNGEDNSSFAESPQEPSAFLEMVDNVDAAESIASIQADLSAMRMNDHVEMAQTLHTIAEEPESRGASPVVSLTTEEVTHFLTTINDVMESSIEAMESVVMVEQRLEELVAVEDIKDHLADIPHQPTCIGSGRVTAVSDAVAQDTQQSPVQTCFAYASTTEELIEDKAAEDVFHDSHDDTEAHPPTSEVEPHIVANVSAAEGYGSDDDEGSSVYSFATTATSFAGDENAAPSMVSSPFWDEPNSRVREVASPLRPAWNPDWMENHRPLPSKVEAPGESLDEDGSQGHSDATAAAAASLSLPANGTNLGDPSLASKKHEELLRSRHEEIRTADVVTEDPADVHHAEDSGYAGVAGVSECTEMTQEVGVIENSISTSPLTSLGVITPVRDSDATSLNEEIVRESMPGTVTPTPLLRPRSYVSAFSGVPTTITKGVSYRQLSVELTPVSEDESSFYRAALQKLKQERQLRSLNPTALEPVASAPSSNSSVYNDEDEDERCARLKKIDELRKRTSAFEVKIGKPLSIGRVAHSMS